VLSLLSPDILFHGARREGIPSVGIVLRENKPYYESFTNALPEIFLEIQDCKEILTDNFQKKRSRKT